VKANTIEPVHRHRVLKVTLITLRPEIFKYKHPAQLAETYILFLVKVTKSNG